jgi:tetratricopeptide (TPR) repeat protein
MKKIPTILFLIFLSALSAQAALPGNELFPAIEMFLVRQDYDSARDMLCRQLTESPGDNDALYLRVAVEQTVLLDYESYLVNDDRFYRLADSARKVLHARLAGLRGADSLRCVFYLAGIEGGIAVFQGKTGNWVSALENAVSSASGLKMVMKRDSTIFGALLGLGIYHYYLGRNFGWLPFINGGSEEAGFREIERATKLPFPYDFPAKNSLCWILIDRKQYGRADSLAQMALAEAPMSTFFLQIRSLALYRENRYAEAIELGERLAAISEARSPVNWSDLVLSYYVLTGSYDALGKGREAQDAAAYITNAAIPAEYRKMSHIKRNMKKIGEILRKYGGGE